jgi:hypothetical protein
MQTCFFAISGVLPRDEAIEKIKDAIEKTYGKKGEESKRNYAAVDGRSPTCTRSEVPESVTSQIEMPPIVAPNAPEFVQNVTAMMMPATATTCRSAPSRRRHLADRTTQVGEAQHRAARSRSGIPGLHPVRQVRPGLPARGDPRQGLRAESC